MKVDEQFKCKDCDNYNLCKYYHNRRETSFICKEFQNQWGVVEELKKIKEEIQAKSQKEIGMDFFDGLAFTEEIIDNHIEELKGKENDND